MSVNLDTYDYGKLSSDLATRFAVESSTAKSMVFHAVTGAYLADSDSKAISVIEKLERLTYNAPVDEGYL